MIHEYLEQAWSMLSHPVANHLLQSTVFAGVAALLTLALRNNSARTRHAIWLIASLKFLVPFALLLGVGAQLGQLVPARPAEQASLWIDQISGHTTLEFAPVPVGVRASSETSTAAWILATWLCGFVGVVLSWLWRWRRVSSAVKTAVVLEDGYERAALDRLQAQAGVRSSIGLAVSRTMLEPGVFGIRRPVLVLPAEVSRHLEPAQLEAVLAHEIAHIRRRDNLLAFLQMIVEAVFWFHPLVWWLGARMMTERERACDEEVLRLGSEPETYAEGILRICKLCIASPLACVSGVTGADLKKRIEQIVSHPIGEGLNRARKVLLAFAGAAALVIPITVGMFTSSGGIAQPAVEENERPSFTVASVKPSDPSNSSHIYVTTGPGGRFAASNVTLRFLIKIAYDLRDDQILGGPSWLSSKRYDVEAQSDPPFGGDPRRMNETERNEFSHQIGLRLQSLLADRFQLRVSHGAKEMALYHLVIAKNGPKLEASPGAPGEEDRLVRMSPGHLDVSRGDMAALAHALSEVTSHTVVDKTGLTGHYDFKLEFTPEPGIGPGPMGPGPGAGPQPPPVDPTAPTLFTAVEEQLGLKLEAHKGQADIVTIDSAQFPSEN